jgi:hypothetical protein
LIEKENYAPIRHAAELPNSFIKRWLLSRGNCRLGHFRNRASHFLQRIGETAHSKSEMPLGFQAGH